MAAAAAAAAALSCSGCAASSVYAWTPAPALRASTTGNLLLLRQQRRWQSSSWHPRVRGSGDLRCRRRLLTARGDYGEEEEDEEEEGSLEGGASFDAAVALFNGGEYHACHDVVEELWYTADEPSRTLLHGVLQCAVAFHHLFNQNHRGAMMELGEGLCKLRKLHLDDDDDDDITSPFACFREEVAVVLSFLYRTQKELAACTDDLCLAMDGSASSYQLLGNFAAGQQLYRLELAADEDHRGEPSIVFSAASRGDEANCHRVRLPRLRATEQHLAELQCTREYSN